MVDRILLHQRHGRGLWNAVRAEILARIDRLIGDVEKDRAAPALRAEERTAAWQACWWPKKFNSKLLRSVSIGRSPIGP